MAMYKTRNTGMGNGMRGMGECYIPGNVQLKHPWECCQIFRGMFSNIPGNIAKHSGECPQTFQGISSNIPGNLLKHSEKCPQTFRWMPSNIPGNVLKDSGECFFFFISCLTSIPIYYLQVYNSTVNLDSQTN